MDHEEPQEFWDRLYADRDQVWSGRVNAVLAQEVAELPPGRALDLGCGEGGDALWLAERGWRVTAVDIAQTALDRGAAEAQRRGLAVGWVRADLSEQLPTGPYDLVSAQFLQSPVEFPRVEVLRRAAAEVAPAGTLLIVGHAEMPPWAHHEPDPALMPGSADVVAQLDLPTADWVVETAEDRSRAATGPDSQTAQLNDSVVRLRRR